MLRHNGRGIVLSVREGEQGTGEICIHSLPLLVLILKESYFFPFQTSLHPSIYALQKGGDLSAFPAFEENGKS